MPTSISPRILNIQVALGVAKTGNYDLATIQSLEKILKISSPKPSILDRRKEIQRRLGFTGRDVDGIFGVATTSRIEMLLDNTLPRLPIGASMIVSRNGLEEIVKFEVSSEALYNRKYQQPIWPKGASGVTIGIGYDLGYNSPAQIRAAWEDHLKEADILKLLKAAGKKGLEAKNALTNEILTVKVPWLAALDVFYSTSLPIYARMTKLTYPKVASLHPDAQAALLSLVYNRGNKIDDTDNRKEMRLLVDAVSNKDFLGMSKLLRDMKRLWAPTSGLISRREKEATLVENGSYFIMPEDCVFV